MTNQVRTLSAAAVVVSVVMGTWLAGCPPAVGTAPVEAPAGAPVVQESAECVSPEAFAPPREDARSRAELGVDASSLVLVAVRTVHGEAAPDISLAPTRLLATGQTMFMGGPVQTGPDGIAMVPMRWDLWEPYEGPIYVEVMGVLATPIRREVSEHGATRVELCVPEMGEVLVSTPGTYGVEHERRPERAVELWQGPRPFGNLEVQFRGAHRPIARGPYHFRQVEIGQQLSARIMRGVRVEGSVSFRGPSLAGEVVRISLERDGLGVAGRLMDADGRPLVGLAVTAYRSPRFGPALLEFSTDADGVLQWTDFRPRRGWPPGVDQLVFLIEEESPHAAPWAPLLVEVPSDWPGSSWDLGVLTVDRLDKIVEGVVVNESGSPVQGVSVRLDWRPDSGGRWERVGIEGLRPTYKKTAANGRFSFFACIEPGDYRLFVSAEGYLRAEHPLPWTGLGDMELTLESGGSLAGEVLVNPGFDPSVLRIEVTNRSGGVDVTGGVDKDGRITVDGIPPGLVEARILLGNGTQIRVLEGLEIVGGQEVNLGSIDLRGQVFSRVVSLFAERVSRKVRSRAHKDAGAGHVLPNFPNNPGLYGTAKDRERRLVGVVTGVVDPGPGLLRITSLTESVEVKIKVAGFRETKWLRITEDCEVMLQRKGD